ncbi:MAG: hypothetical protein V2A34_12400, partial [Lentisphaerota bacterium]
MDEPQINYRRAYLKSKTHFWWGMLTLGLGFLSAEPLGLIAGAVAYILGWIYIPDFPFFRRHVDRRIEAEKNAALLAQAQAFMARRDSQLASLMSHRRTRYNELARVCHDIEKATSETPGTSGDQALITRLRKLEESMWTYLKLLMIEQSLEVFLETDRKDDVPRLIKEAEAECLRLSTDIDKLKSGGSQASMETKQRLLNSKEERLEVLRKRIQRAEQAQENLNLAISEQERLDQQIKLIRADAVASKNADMLSARIDASFQHLEQTNKWLSEMAEFKDVAGDLPPPDMRIGFGAQPQQ